MLGMCCAIRGRSTKIIPSTMRENPISVIGGIVVNVFL